MDLALSKKRKSKVADCYSDGERNWMIRTQQFRAKLFRPLLELMERIGVTPDHLTLLSFLCGLAFCPIYFWSSGFAFGMLLLHVLIDGLDGPLARHLGVDSRRGSFTDTMADQSVIAACTITLMFAGTVSVISGTLYVFLYTVVVLFAMARNALRIPYTWLIRPRFVVYLWMVVEAWFWPGTLVYVLWFFNGVLLIKMLTGFLKIRRRI